MHLSHVVRKNRRSAEQRRGAGKANAPSCFEDELFLPRAQVPFPLLRPGTPSTRRRRAFLRSFPLALDVGGDLLLQAHPSDERRRSAAAVVPGRRSVCGRGRCSSGGCTCWCGREWVRGGARVGRGSEVRGRWLRNPTWKLKVRSPMFSSSSSSWPPLEIQHWK